MHARAHEQAYSSCLPSGLAAAPFAAQGFQSSDATYHEKAGSKASTPAKPAEPLAESVSYPKSALTKMRNSAELPLNSLARVTASGWW